MSRGFTPGTADSRDGAQSDKHGNAHASHDVALDSARAGAKSSGPTRWCSINGEAGNDQTTGQTLYSRAAWTERTLNRVHDLETCAAGTRRDECWRKCRK